MLDKIFIWQLIGNSLKVHFKFELMHFSRQPGSQNWGFSLRRGKPCLEKWRNIPLDTDILITHGPPVGEGLKFTQRFYNPA